MLVVFRARCVMLFFTQKTAYEMRISDWSSDVCSSDLAPDRAGFVAGTIEGTRAIVAAAERANVRRFVHVSSLAAREPALSVYGWSKAEAEKVVEASALDWVMVRPPAIYGPGDMEMRDLFRLARWGIALLPPPGKLSVIEVSDLARLLLALVDGRYKDRKSVV